MSSSGRIVFGRVSAAGLALLLALAVGSFSVSFLRTAQADEGGDTSVVPDLGPAPVDYVVGEHKSHAPVIRVYKDSNAWFGENRDHATLLALGKILTDDYFIHPLSDLSTGIPSGTAVVFLSSNGFGLSSAAAAQNDPAAQANLASFLAGGGVLVVDMGDNLFSGGFIAPGATGTPDLILGPFDATTCRDATLVSGALGPDGVLGTPDDHPIVKGLDGIAGTADDLDNSNIDLASFSCWVSHGNLVDGITLPADATVLMTRSFDGGATQDPILAEYCFESGRVILDTITKEFSGHPPVGAGPTPFLTSLLAYALSPAAQCVVPFDAFSVDVEIEVEDDDDDDEDDEDNEDEEDELEVEGSFTLGADSDGIDPLSEDVTLQVGAFTVTILAGSFELDDDDEWEFEGDIDGLEVEAEIELEDDGTYEFEFEVEGADFSGIANPVEVTLTIGDDTGTVIVIAEFDD